MVVNLIKKIKAINHALNLFKSEADIIDIGGESTRPGSKAISSKQEWNRIVKNTLNNIIRKLIYH